VNQFFAVVIRNRDQLPIVIKNTKNSKEAVQMIFDYIDRHYAEPVTLRSAAEAAYLSVPQFMRVFKNATGMTFKYYLNLYRVNQSAEFLRQGYTTAETATKCGFENVNTFIRVFKQHKKFTPSYYKM
jgi:transcriptional regulator GlxA family with amidase domain